MTRYSFMFEKLNIYLQNFIIYFMTIQYILFKNIHHTTIAMHCVTVSITLFIDRIILRKFVHTFLLVANFSCLVRRNPKSICGSKSRLGSNFFEVGVHHHTSSLECMTLTFFPTCIECFAFLLAN